MSEMRLYRSRDAYLGGVCAGIAERLDADPIVVRIFVVLFTFVTVGLGAIVYLVMWARMPLKPEGPEPFEVLPESAESFAYGKQDHRFGLLAASRGRYGNTLPGAPSIVVRLAVAVCLMLLFLAVAMNASPMVEGTHWWQFWPLAFVICGLCLIVIPIRSNHESLWHALGIVLTSVAAMMFPISLGVVSWSTLPYAFSQLWLLLLVAVVLVLVGVAVKMDAVMLAGSLCIVAFCLITLYFYALPGASEALTVLMPNGRAFLVLID